LLLVIWAGLGALLLVKPLQLEKLRRDQ
jgi:hypothetical protein